MSTTTVSTRDQILDAAERLFARQGFDPTTIKEIGSDAGLTPALLYYYFRSKEDLYREVLQRVAEDLVSRGRAGLDAAATPEEAIRSLVGAQVEFLLSHPNAPKLLVREMVDHDARHAEAIILQLSAGIFRRLCEQIEEGQRAGRFRPDVEPRFAAVSTIAQVVYFTIARPAIGLLFGAGPDGVSEATARAFGRHAGEFAVHALSTPEHT
jgi:TetR/AcrR family transcriptional regulator